MNEDITELLLTVNKSAKVYCWTFPF